MSIQIKSFINIYYTKKAIKFSTFFHTSKTDRNDKTLRHTNLVTEMTY